MKYLSPEEIKKILHQDFNLTAAEIDRYQELFTDDYASPKIYGTIKFINNKPHIFKDIEHKRNTILKKLRELHDPLLNVNSARSVIQNIRNKNKFN